MSYIAILAGISFQRVDNDIVYATVGKTQLTLDAYRPSSPNGKVFIAIHGGGFTGGKKGGNTGELCRYLSGRGFTCFDINYRLQSDVGGTKQDAVNAAIEDATTAFNWVTKNATTYGGNPSRIAIGGSSAGAITALYATYSRRLPVKAVIDLWGGMYGKENDMKRNDPPVLIVHGVNDKLVSISLARAIENRARAVQVPVRFLSHEGGHGMNLNATIKNFTILEHIDSFLRETMK